MWMIQWGRAWVDQLRFSLRVWCHMTLMFPVVNLLGDGGRSWGSILSTLLCKHHLLYDILVVGNLMWAEWIARLIDIPVWSGLLSFLWSLLASPSDEVWHLHLEALLAIYSSEVHELGERSKFHPKEPVDIHEFYSGYILCSGDTLPMPFSALLHTHLLVCIGKGILESPL